MYCFRLYVLKELLFGFIHDSFDSLWRQEKLLTELFKGDAIQQAPLQYIPVTLGKNPFIDQMGNLRPG